MAAKKYTVETRGQAVAIFSAPKSLGSHLARAFESRGLRALIPASTEEITALRTSHDLDYLVLFPSPLSSELLSTLTPLLQSGESRLYFVVGEGNSSLLCPLAPLTKKIIHCDYLSTDELSSPLLTSWLSSIETHQSLEILGDGLSPVSLLSAVDLAELLALEILLPTRSYNQTVYVGNPVGLSTLNLAYFLRTHLPFKIRLSFRAGPASTGDGEGGPDYTDTLDRLHYQLTGDPQDLLKAYLKTHVKGETVQKVPTPPVSTKAMPPKLTPLKLPTPIFVPLSTPRSRRTLRLPRVLPLFRSIAMRGLIIALALYLGSLAFSLTVSLLSLKSLAGSLRQNELPRVSALTSFSTTYLQANWVALSLFPGVSHNSSYAQINLLLDAYQQSLQILAQTHALSSSAQDLLHYVFGSGGGDIAQMISQSRLATEELYQQLSLLDGSLPSTPPSVLPDRYQSAYSAGKTRLTQFKRSLLTSKALLASAPDVIGLGSRRKYAVLFQNNMELRATGGFIGSFAIVSFENGKLYDMPIYDVYDADGQLKGHVEPPGPIKDVLGEANWYLRDSNFDPDFPTTARRAEWFIKKSLSQDLDGTLAVDVDSLKSILSALGPVEVPDYNETITPGNLYERAQFHAEVNFFPGSTQKKEFLSSVAAALFTRLPQVGAGEGLRLVASLNSALEEKSVLISLLNPNSSHVFETLLWDGQLLDPPCPSPTHCHQDYAMVVDSNFGVNKANYFIKRRLEEVLTFDKNLSLSHRLRLSYQNTATSTAWPAGAYKNYQRLYLPQGAHLQGVKLGERPLSAKDYTLTLEHNKVVLGYLVNVPVGESLVVEVEYSTPQLPQEDEFIYSWYWQKQPGTSAGDPLTVYLNYPLYLKPQIISPEAQLTPQQLKFSFTNDTNHRLTVKFSK